MISEKERARWFSQQRALFAEPGCEAERRGGKDYARTLAKLCPHCGETFWTYQVMGEEHQPYQQDPYPMPGDKLQTRETCGSPKCWDDELNVAFRRMYAAEQAQKRPPVEAPQAAGQPRLVRNRTNKNLQPLKDMTP